MDNLLNRIHFADCLDVLRSLPDGSVDLFLQDPPYSKTALAWDKQIDLSGLWVEWKRVAKPTAAFVFTSMQPFSSDLVFSQKRWFRYEWIWDKGRGNNFMSTKFMPFIEHESVLVFYQKLPTYNPQRVNRTEKSLKRYGIGATRDFDKIYRHETTGQDTPVARLSADGKRMPSNFLNFNVSAERGKGKNLHPTQKPIELFRYLIRTYSNPGDVVFDGYGGSGTTAIAAQMEGRKFIVCENHYPYFEASTARLSNLVAAPYLFSDCR